MTKTLPVRASSKGNGIVVSFVYRNQTQHETLPLKPTKPNLSYAERLLDAIQRDLLSGCFQYSKYFPNSKQVKKHDLVILDEFHHPTPIDMTFSHVVHRWRKTLDHHSKGTRLHYQSALSNYWLPALGDKAISEIKYSEVAELISSISWKSPKHHNNCLVPLRRVFDLAFMDGLIQRNPMQRIKNRRLNKKVPNPLSMEQVHEILVYMQQHFHPTIAIYFQFAFYTGLRIEEQIALRWHDVDLANKTIYIHKARTAGEEKGTKTGVNRWVDLNEEALSALAQQQPYSYEISDHVFLNPNTDKPWNDTKAQRMHYWNPTLKALNIPYRRSYETRHAYATMLLMSGCKHAYAAQQMGHSVAMFLNVYSRWINRTQMNQEREKVTQFLNESKQID